MDAEPIKEKQREIIEKYGPWTSHNMYLGAGVYTLGKDKELWGARHLKRVVQIVADVARKPLKDLRVLDLACLEGVFAIEFARQGAEVVAIEGREANIEKVRFVKELLSLDNLSLIQDDVRNLSANTHGYFDVVLCLGILYHLDMPDAILFLQKIFDVCRGFAIIDTHVSMTPERRYVYNGQEYWGKTYIEHGVTSSPDEKANALWASLEDPESFWFTQASLINALEDVGFTSIHRCLTPRTYLGHDRITLLAMKGVQQPLFSFPKATDWIDPLARWPERPRLFSLMLKTAIRMGRLVPQNIKEKFIRFLL